VTRRGLEEGDNVMRVQADRDRCIGSGQCVMNAPDVFDQDEDEGLVSLKTSTPAPGLADDVRRAAAMCPALAITLTER
jgi:ferredoxin